MAVNDKKQGTDTSDGMTLLKKIIQNTLAPGDLDHEERRTVLDILDGPYASETGKPCYTQEEMGALLHVSRVTISKDLKILRRRRGHLVTHSDLVDAAGELRSSKRIAQQGARKAGDLALFWRIELEYLQALQRLGIIREVPAELTVNGRMSVAHSHAFQTFDPDTTAGLLKIAHGDRGRLIASNTPADRN